MAFSPLATSLMLEYIHLRVDLPQPKVLTLDKLSNARRKFKKIQSLFLLKMDRVNM